jgi:hypothetical protein
MQQHFLSLWQCKALGKAAAKQRSDSFFLQTGAAAAAATLPLLAFFLPLGCLKRALNCKILQIALSTPKPEKQ